MRIQKRYSQNVGQALVRACIFALMGIASTAPLPAPQTRAEGFWSAPVMCIDGSTGIPHNGSHIFELFLRPNWMVPWVENKAAWLMKVVKRIKTHGTLYTDSLTQEKLDQMLTVRISKAVETVFTSLAERYKLENSQDSEEKQNKRKLTAKTHGRKSSVSDL